MKASVSSAAVNSLRFKASRASNNVSWVRSVTSSLPFLRFRAHERGRLSAERDLETSGRAWEFDARADPHAPAARSSALAARRTLLFEVVLAVPIETDNSEQDRKRRLHHLGDLARANDKTSHADGLGCQRARCRRRLF